MQFSQRQTGLTESLELVVDLTDWFDWHDWFGWSAVVTDTTVGILLVNRMDEVVKLV